MHYISISNNSYLITLYTYFQIEIINFRDYSRYDLEIQTSLGWEEKKVKTLSLTIEGLSLMVF